MKSVNFFKLQASGNDFVLLDQRRNPKKINYTEFAKKYCDRKFGIGADGILILESTRQANFRMRIINADGSEASMCGNGARAAALFFSQDKKTIKTIKFETKAGMIQANVNCDNVKIKLTDPLDLKLDFPIELDNRWLRVNFVNTGVPHVVVFSQGLDKIDVATIGRKIRQHKYFAPMGTNANFLEFIDSKTIAVRTYERGVEDETLACGTGSTASAIISVVKDKGLSIQGDFCVNVRVRSGEILKIYFNINNKKISNVWLEGCAQLIYKGVVYV